VNIVAAAVVGALALSVVVGGQVPGPVTTVAAVDLTRYEGQWFEVARFENRFQRQCVGDVRATYTRRSDGRIDVLNTCRTTSGSMTSVLGEARVVDTASNAKLEVRFAPSWLSFLPMVWGDYWVIGLDPSYRWAVVGEPSREYLWILSRTPTLDTATYDHAVAMARAVGFDVQRLVKTAPAVGSPGSLASP